MFSPIHGGELEWGRNAKDQVALTDLAVGMAALSPVRALSPVKSSSTPAFSKVAKKLRGDSGDNQPTGRIKFCRLVPGFSKNR